MMTLDEIREFARGAHLEKSELLDDDAAVGRDCNGIGAAWFPAWLRAAANWMHPALYVASFIHDREYAIGGNYFDRLRADWRFLRNGIASANYCYGVFSLRTLTIAWQSLRFYFALRIGGKFAWHK